MKMKKTILGFLVVIMLLAVCIPVLAETSIYGKYLTIADVEKAGDIKGIKLVPHDPKKGAGGDLNFADSQNNLILMVLFSSASTYDQSKALKDYVKATITGIGDTAFTGPAKNPQIMVYFKKGTQSVSLSTYYNLTGTGKNPTMLTMDQLIALSKIVASRVK
jgi:hypothetical protein